MERLIIFSVIPASIGGFDLKSPNLMVKPEKGGFIVKPRDSNLEKQEQW